MNGVPQEDLDALIERNPQLWHMLDGARLFMTGGTGFFGLWLVESALHARKTLDIDLEITLLSRNPAQALANRPHWREQAGLHWLQGDVRDFTIPTAQFTHIVHAATDTCPEKQKNRAALLDVLVGGTRRVMELASLKKVQRVLYVSSGAVYGKNTSSQPLSESSGCILDSMDNTASYGIGKYFAEHLGLTTAEEAGIEFVSGRCFAFIGPGLPIAGHFAIGNFIRDALTAPEIVIKGDGTAVRSYLYAADLCIWLYSLLLRAPAGKAYNVGSDRPMSIAEIASLVRDELSPGKHIRTLASPRNGAPRDWYIPDVNQARKDLCLIAWTPLEVAIRRTAEWFQTTQTSEHLISPNQQDPS